MSMKDNKLIAVTGIALSVMVGLVATQNANCLWGLFFIAFLIDNNE